MENSDRSFVYNYSAPRQDEVRAIREKYLPKQKSKLEQLRCLDESVTRRSMVVALSQGIVSLLTLGLGICCVMVRGRGLYIPGILVGVLGTIGVILAYPVYTRTVKKERQRIAPSILRLVNELMGGQL